MSRIYEVLKDKENQQVATASPAQAQVPAEYVDELEKFRKAALPNLRGYLLGTLLRFKQTGKGEWIYGDKKLDNGTQLVALMNYASHGWLKWENKVATHVVGRISDGFVPPPRSELDCQDEATWPIGLSGKKEDPWKEVVYVPFVSLDGETLFTFATTTKTGRPVVWKFVDRYAWIGRKHPGQYPIVELQANGFENSFGGWTPTPQFEIVGWTDRPDIEQLTAGDGDGGSDGDSAGGATEPPLRDDMDDSIPF
jgi:hypothetical protein